MTLSAGAVSILPPSPDECRQMGVVCACFNLRKAARAVTAFFDDALRNVGLKATQVTILAAIQGQRNGGAQQGPPARALAETLGMDPSTLSRNLAVLERDGLVNCRTGDDRRVRCIGLTPAGEAALTLAFPVWMEAQARLEDEFESSEFEGGLDFLRRMDRSAR